MQGIPHEGVCWAESLLVTRKHLEGQLIVNCEIYAPGGAVKQANAKNAACVWKQLREVSPSARRLVSVCPGWWQTARGRHLRRTASSKSQLVIAKFWDLLLGAK